MALSTPKTISYNQFVTQKVIGQIVSLPGSLDYLVQFDSKFAALDANTNRATFKDACQGISRTLLVIHLSNDHVIMIYTSLPWGNSGVTMADPQAFIATATSIHANEVRFLTPVVGNVQQIHHGSTYVVGLGDQGADLKLSDDWTTFTIGAAPVSFAGSFLGAYPAATAITKLEMLRVVPVREMPPRTWDFSNVVPMPNAAPFIHPIPEVPQNGPLIDMAGALKRKKYDAWPIVVFAVESTNCGPEALISTLVAAMRHKGTFKDLGLGRSLLPQALQSPTGKIILDSATVTVPTVTYRDRCKMLSIKLSAFGTIGTSLKDQGPEVTDGSYIYPFDIEFRPVCADSPSEDAKLAIHGDLASGIPPALSVIVAIRPDQIPLLDTFIKKFGELFPRELNLGSPTVVLTHCDGLAPFLAQHPELLHHSAQVFPYRKLVSSAFHCPCLPAICWGGSYHLSPTLNVNIIEQGRHIMKACLASAGHHAGEDVLPHAAVQSGNILPSVD
jgi:hypothetical protein